LKDSGFRFASGSIDKLSKVADIVNKKLIVLLAIAGGIGAYAVKFIEQNNIFGYALGIIFIVASVGVAYNYNELNRLKHMIEEL
jgi:nicotinamide riboside transporter PnuC